MDGEGWSVYERASQAFRLDDWKIGDGYQKISSVKIVREGDVFCIFSFYLFTFGERNGDDLIKMKFFLR